MIIYIKHRIGAHIAPPELLSSLGKLCDGLALLAVMTIPSSSCRTSLAHSSLRAQKAATVSRHRRLGRKSEVDRATVRQGLRSS